MEWWCSSIAVAFQISCSQHHVNCSPLTSLTLPNLVDQLLSFTSLHCDGLVGSSSLKPVAKSRFDAVCHLERTLVKQIGVIAARPILEKVLQSPTNGIPSIMDNVEIPKQGHDRPTENVGFGGIRLSEPCRPLQTESLSPWECPHMSTVHRALCSFALYGYWSQIQLGTNGSLLDETYELCRYLLSKRLEDSCGPSTINIGGLMLYRSPSKLDFPQ